MWRWAVAATLVVCGCASIKAPASGAKVTADASSADAGDAGPIGVGPLDSCPPLFGSGCLSVYPSFALLKPDKTSKTGVRVDLLASLLPKNGNGKPIDPASWNRRDGFSPVTPVIILPPKPVDPKVLAGETKPDDTLESNVATLMVDAATGKPIRHLAELDQNTQDDGRRALILRPYAPLGYGRKIIVALTTSLLGTDGKPMPKQVEFAGILDGSATHGNGRLNRFLEEWRQDYAVLLKMGAQPETIVATWHFVTASEDWVTGPAKSLREQFLAKVGANGMGLKIDKIEVDPDFASVLPNLQQAPLPDGATVIVAKIHQDIALRVQGQFELPDAMSDGQTNESMLNWVGDGPAIELQAKTTWRPFALIAGPKALQADAPPPLTLYGHGFLRQICMDFCIGAGIADAASHFFHAAGAVAVGTDWWGLSQPELPIALGITADFSKAPQLTEKLLHGALSFIALSRAVQSKLANDPRFAVVAKTGAAPRSLTDGGQGLRYNGNSLGGIMGTTMVALHPDVERAVVNVAGGVWSTMMNRSSNFAAFLAVVGASMPDPYDQQIAFALMQTHWDLADPVHFAPFLGTKPLPAVHKDRKVLWPISWGDSQVPQLASAMLARASGAVLLGPPVQNWPDVATSDTQPFSGTTAVVQWDSLRGTHPPGNAAPAEDNMSHYATRWMPEYQQMIGRFLYGDGLIEQRYCLARDTDGKLPCTLKQDIPEKAKDMPALPTLPPPPYAGN